MCGNCKTVQGPFVKTVYPLPIGVVRVCKDLEACTKRRKAIDPPELLDGHVMVVFGDNR